MSTFAFEGFVSWAGIHAEYLWNIKKKQNARAVFLLCYIRLWCIVIFEWENIYVNFNQLQIVKANWPNVKILKK